MIYSTAQPTVDIADKAVPLYLQDPRDGSGFERLEGDRIYFAGGNSYAVHQGVPVLIDERDSVFSVRDIISDRPTTQDADYRSRGQLKNYVRQRLLPALTCDGLSHERYMRLARLVSGARVLVLGAGDKGDYYRRCFADAKVVTSDVHLQFGADVVLDAHRIPFRDTTFALVLAAQVLEHTARPWLAAAEMQRVTKAGGYIQVEVPFAFPFHGAPYDFYRFTPTALRFLFAHAEVLSLEATEGPWSGAAVATTQALVDSFSNRYLRMAGVAAGRLSLWWMKYLDRFSRNSFNMPKGFAATYRKEWRARTDREMLDEVRVYEG